MTPRMSIVGQIAHLRLLTQLRWRAVLFGGLTLVFALLTFFPERYLATSSFTPTDRDSLGLSGTLGQLGALNSVFGNQAAVEVALRVGRSDAVRDVVIDKTRLKDRAKTESRIAQQRYLADRVEVRSLRGGIITIEMQDRDAALGQEIVAAYQLAVREELGRIAKRQTAYKRDVLKQLVVSASEQLGQAQSAYDDFRLRNSYAEPRVAIAAFGERVPQLEGTIRAKEIQLATARQVYTDKNLVIRQLEAEIGALRIQLEQARATSPNQGQGVGDLVQNSSKLYRLERELEIAKSLYSGYMRYLQGTAVEDLTSDANLRVLEPPHVDSRRQVWPPALALAIAIFLLWIAIEAYRLRPPPGEAPTEAGNA